MNGMLSDSSKGIAYFVYKIFYVKSVTLCNILFWSFKNYFQRLLAKIISRKNFITVLSCKYRRIIYFLQILQKFIGLERYIYIYINYYSLNMYKLL